MAAPDGWEVTFDTPTMKRWQHRTRGEEVSITKYKNQSKWYVFVKAKDGRGDRGMFPMGSKSAAAREAHTQMRNLNKFARMNK